MKKLYSLIFSVVLFFTSTAQVLLQEGFETSFPPAGWTSINAGSGNNWLRNDNALLQDGPYPAHGGSYSMVYEYSATAAANAWMITPAVNLTAGVSYTISFYYRVRSSSYPEKLKVTVGNAPTVAAQTTTLWDNAGGTQLTNTSFALGAANYTPSSSGPFYFGFNAYSISDQWAIIVDDVRIEVTPTSAPACATNITPANGATNVAAPYLTLSWNASAGASGYDVYIGTTNPPTSLVTNTGSTSITLVGAAYSTTYYWYVVPRNSVGPATGCTANITSFTTMAPPPPPANDECASATSISPYNGTMNGTTVSGTASPGIVLCATSPGTPDEDVWYKFTALQNGNATITVTGGPFFDAVLQAFSGTCGSLVQMGSCVDDTGDGEMEVLNLTGLAAGQTYYLRVYDWGSGSGDVFTIAASGTALPVSISDFTGVRQGGKNILSWTTFNEQNNYGFELQRSADGVNFSSLAFVGSKASNGASNGAIKYSSDDVKPIAGTNYYRLKQIDNDGRSTLSKVVSLKGDKISSIQLMGIYPNPVVNRLNILVASPFNNSVKLVVTDLAGKIVMQQTKALTAGDNNLDVNVDELPAGSYFVKLVCANSCETAAQKFVKQ
jgi:hypothetical protein